MYFFINKVFKTTAVASCPSGAGPFPTDLGAGQGTAGMSQRPSARKAASTPGPIPMALEPWLWNPDSDPEGAPCPGQRSPNPPSCGSPKGKREGPA